MNNPWLNKKKERTLPGAQNLGDDEEYFRKLLFNPLNFPGKYFDDSIKDEPKHLDDGDGLF